MVMKAVGPERRGLEVVVDTRAAFLVALTIAKGTVTFHFTLSLMGKIVKNGVGFIWCRERIFIRPMDTEFARIIFKEGRKLISTMCLQSLQKLQSKQPIRKKNC